ncbi:CSC1-like protein At3g54510 isoform X1 [Typha angustifolia]|uniref:CSC1-like protein At3g54510 isoform X1 n=1 Tax=Typha angustifolia TaxID=59011 RepID=UPI003C2DB1B3
MNPESLVASAAINLGLALVVLYLFSVLKKQPGNAPVYFARRIAAGEEVPVDRPFSLRRLRPSVSWIPAAFRLSEDEVLRRRGLDALVVLRLFKFGIRFFTVCSVVGLLILVPVNYTCQEDPSSVKLSHSMDSFTISSVRRGSNRLWVHFSCLCFISFYVMYLLHKEYKSILKLRILQIGYHRQHPDQFTVLVRGIPLCTEHDARGCSVDHFFSKYYPFTYQSYQIIYDGQNIEELLSLASSIEIKIKKLQHKRFQKCYLGHWLCSKFRSDFADVAVYEERLKEVCQRIRLLQCDNILKHKELPVAFVSFKSRLGAALAAETQQHVNPLLWITEFAPGTNDILWHNLAIPYRRLAVHRIGALIAAVLLIVFFAFPVTAVQGIVQFEKVKKWFPLARAVQLIPGLNSILTGYLPSAILNGFIYLIPYAMLAMASLEGCVSKSKRDMKACSMVFYFLVGNVFFLSLLSGSLLDQIGESFAHPKDFPSHLASAVSAQSDFFITYILTDGMSGFSLEVLQLGLLSWHFMKVSIGQGTKEDPYLYGFPYYRVVPIVSLAILIGMVYAVIAPLLLPFLIIYFLLGYAVYVNQMQDVYEIVYDTCGQYWPYIHHYIFITVILMQITMIGLFGLKSKPGASISTIPLLVLSCLFNEYCKIRFLPTFCHRPVQNAKDNDNLDEMEGLAESNLGSAINAYQPPWMRPVCFTEEPSSIQPLVTS